MWADSALTLNKVDGIPPAMRIGCGVTTKEIRGKPYVYFWRYEDRNGRSVQVYRYLGPATSEESRQRLAQAIEDYFNSLDEALRRRKEDLLSRVALP